MGRQVKSRKANNRTQNWIIPKIEKKPTRDYGEVTDGRKQALAQARIEKNKPQSARDAKIEAFRKAQGWA